MTVYISPPFGNYIKKTHCTSIKGTFTWERRSGLLLQIIKTLRPVKGGWRNAIGFRNVGMKNIKNCDKKAMYSIAALDSHWDPFLAHIPNWSDIELNLGCPNVGGYSITKQELMSFTDKYKMLQVKVSPTVDLDYIKWLQDCGVVTVHLSNTIPTDRGGISGSQLREVNLPLVEKIATETNLTIIAGGGIYHPRDVVAYRLAGATSFSLSTIWFTPWKVGPVLDEVYGR